VLQPTNNVKCARDGKSIQVSECQKKIINIERGLTVLLRK